MTQLFNDGIQHWDLERQCAELKVEINNFALASAYHMNYPELALLKWYKAQNYVGVYAEWRFIMTVLKLLCEDSMEDHRYYCLTFMYHTESSDRMGNHDHHQKRVGACLSNFDKSTRYDMLDRFFYSQQRNRCGQLGYEHAQNWAPSYLLEFYDSMGKDLLRNILVMIMEKPETRRFGWPDLTIMKDRQVKFVEVKLPGENLTIRQIELIRDVMKPCGLDVSVIIVYPPLAVNNHK